MQPIPVPQSRAPTVCDAAYPHPMIPMALPTGVHVFVEGVPFQYQLTQDDLLKVFSRYGAVSNISVMDDGGSAVVQYALASDAAKAQTFLDGKVLNGVQGSLRVTLFPSVPLGRPTYDRVIQPLQSVQKKYTCRFEIPTDIDKDYAVAKRIIGMKGAHMKKIVNSLPSADCAKIRLRGQVCTVPELLHSFRVPGFWKAPTKWRVMKISVCCFFTQLRVPCRSVREL
jgi:hypothetical protein